MLKRYQFKGWKDGECVDFSVEAFNKEAYRHVYGWIIIKNELSFTIMEGEGFRDFHAKVCP